MEGSTAGDRKRRHEELEEAGSPEISSQEAKRLLVDILDDDAEVGERDLASIMKSLEEEIVLLPSSPLPLAPADLGELEFLFEASDDVLGLPPPSEEAGEVEVAGDGGFQGSELLQIWGLDDDELGAYEGFECAILPEKKAEEGAVIDEGLFEYSDLAFCGSSDFADLSWRPETLPAV